MKIVSVVANIVLSRCFAIAVVATILTFMLATHASAQTTLWLDTQPTAGLQGGTATWDTTTSTWNTVAAPGTGGQVAWTNDAIADFATGTPSTLTIGTGQTISIEGMILTSSAANSTTINGGTIQIDGTTAGGAVLTNGFGASVLTINSNVVLNAVTATGKAINYSSTGMVINGNISDGASHSIVRVNNNTTLNGNNTNSGGMQVEKGVILTIGQGTSLGTGTVALVGNASSATATVLATNFASDSTVANALQLSGTTTTSYVTISSNGTGTANYSNTGAIAFGVYNFLGSPQAAAPFVISLSGTSGSTSDSNTFSTSIRDSAITAATGGSGGNVTSLVKAGAGTWMVNGTNNYTGGTTVRAGTLIIGGNAGSTTVANDASTFTYGTGAGGSQITLASGTVANGSQIVFNGTKAPTGITLGQAYYVVNSSGGSFQVSSTLGGSAIALTNNGPSNVQAYQVGALGATNTAVVLGDSGSATTDNVALLTGGAYAIDLPLTVNNNNSSGTTTIGGNTDDNSSFTGNIALNRNVNLRSVTTGSRAVTYTSVISSSGNFGVTTTGTGTSILAGANTYSGPTTVASGKLLVNNTSGSGTGSGAINVTGGTFGGSGSVAPGNNTLTVGSGGTLAPGTAGSSTTSLTVDAAGNGQSSPMVVLTGATLAFNLGAGNTASSLNLTNSYLNEVLGLNGNVFNFNDLTSGGLSTGEYTLISTDDSFQNPFSGLNTGVLAGYTINGLSSYTTQLELNQDGTTGDYILQLDVLAAVPEPSTWALMLGGLFALVFVQARRRKV